MRRLGVISVSFLQIVVACVVLILLPSSVAVSGPPEEKGICHDNELNDDKEAYFDCVHRDFNSLENDKKENVVCRGKKITWYVTGPKNTIVKINFVETDRCKGVSPFGTPIKEYRIEKAHKFTKIKSHSVQAQYEGACYNYEFTCTLADKSVTKVDPIIIVPKP